MRAHQEQQYLDLLRKVSQTGSQRMDRTGTGARSLFGEQLRFSLWEEFPLLTTKRIYWKAIVHELLWLISGSTNVRYLQENNVHIWDEWADEKGDLGPVYGKQWRQWQTTDHEKKIDQLAQVIQGLKDDPFGRRHIVTAWNPADVGRMALPPCHCFFQFFVTESMMRNGEKYLSCQLYQRSADIFLGVPFNIASYSLLTMMVAKACGYQPGEFIHTFGDVHLYNNHREQAKLQLSRTPLPLPIVDLSERPCGIDDFKFEDIILKDYNSWNAIPAPVAV